MLSRLLPRAVGAARHASTAPAQAVILAAGSSSRLADAFAGPKCFAPVAGTPIIERSLASFRSQGVSDIVVVRGPQREAFDGLGGVTLVDNEKHASTGQLQSLASSVSAWREDADIFVSYGDIVFPDRVLAALAEAEGDVCVVVDRDFRRTRGGAATGDLELVTLSEDGATVSTIGKGGDADAAQGEFIGLAKLSASARATLEELTAQLGPDAAFADLLQAAVSQGRLAVTPVSVYGSWREVDSAADLEAANDAMAFLNDQTVSEAHVRAMGAAFLSEANDLKRPTEIVAAELGLDHGLLRAFIDGHVELGTAHELIQTLSANYPVALSSMLVETDDTEAGVVCLSAADSEATSRVLNRVDRHGVRTPYYEYRDSAMSRIGPFRPEWIKELRVVTDNDPENPDVAYNNGHLMLQTTFFIGPVNFYYELDGVKHCFEANTGDSNFISPFVPHSFSSRDPDQEALIIAVTFAGGVRASMDAFGRIGPDKISALCGDARDSSGYEALLRRRMSAEMLTEATLAGKLQAGGLSAQRAGELAAGAEPSREERAALALALNVKESDIFSAPLTQAEEVVVVRGDEAEAFPFPSADSPSYTLKQLSRSVHQPDMKAFDITVHATDAASAANMECGLHQFVYNHGEAPVTLTWGGRTRVLASGDSCYVSPLVAHSFASAPGSEGKLFVVRIPGSFTQETLGEFATYQGAGRSRVGRETVRWYN